MKVTGFSFIKNALKYDYPIVEAIKSILPICDEFVVAVGKSEEDTLGLIKSIDPYKIKIIETEWDENLREGGSVLAEETNKAFAAISENSDWAFYIQGDEVVHEKYLETIKSAMEKYKGAKNVDGLLFKYLHFYGSFDFVGDSSAWYDHEIRVIKNNKKIYSYRDAQGFRKNDNEKLRVIPVDAYIYHYGYVKEPKAMQEKQESFGRYWHTDEWMKDNIVKAEEFKYEGLKLKLARFSGGHPKIMEERVKAKNWKFEYDISFDNKTLKDKAKDFLKKYLNLDFGYHNYIIEKKPELD